MSILISKNPKSYSFNELKQRKISRLKQQFEDLQPNVWNLSARVAWCRMWLRIFVWLLYLGKHKLKMFILQLFPASV